MFFSVQLRLGNECDFHGMLELARTVLVNLCECFESRYQKKECSVLPTTQQKQRTSEGPTGLVVAQQAYRGVEVLRKLGTKMKLTRGA